MLTVSTFKRDLPDDCFIQFVDPKTGKMVKETDKGKLVALIEGWQQALKDISPLVGSPNLKDVHQVVEVELIPIFTFHTQYTLIIPPVVPLLGEKYTTECVYEDPDVELTFGELAGADQYVTFYRVILPEGTFLVKLTVCSPVEVGDASQPRQIGEKLTHSQRMKAFAKFLQRVKQHHPLAERLLNGGLPLGIEQELVLVEHQLEELQKKAVLEELREKFPR